MANISVELDRAARAILKTYHQVNDTPINGHNRRVNHSNYVVSEESDLEKEIKQLKIELNDKEERLAMLNRQLQDRTNIMIRLQEDYENVLSQLGHIRV